MSVRARLTSSLGAAGFSALAPTLGQVLIVPLLVVRWGAVGYGEWIALTALATYLNYANVGIPSALRASMAIAYGQKNRAAMVESFQTSALAIFGIALLLGCGFIAAAQVAPTGAFVKGGFLGEGQTRFVASMLGLQIVILIASGVLQAALAALGGYALTMMMDAVRQLIEFAFLFVLVGALRFGPTTVCLIYPVLAATYGVLLAGLLVRRAPWLFAWPWRPRAEVMRRLAQPMAGVMAVSLGYYGLSIQAPRLILLGVVGPAAVATYAVTMMMMRLTRLPIAVLAHAPSVEFSVAHGENDQLRARRLLMRTLRASLWLSLAAIPVVVLLGPPVVHVWTRGRVEASFVLVLLLSVCTALFSLSLPCQEALMSLGKLGKATGWLALGSGPMVALAYFLTRRFGLDGMGAAMVALDGAYAALAIAWVLPLFGFKPRDFLRELMTPPVDVLASEAGRIVRTVRGRLAPRPS